MVAEILKAGKFINRMLYSPEKLDDYVDTSAIPSTKRKLDDSYEMETVPAVKKIKIQGDSEFFPDGYKFPEQFPDGYPDEKTKFLWFLCLSGISMLKSFYGNHYSLDDDKFEDTIERYDYLYWQTDILHQFLSTFNTDNIFKNNDLVVLMQDIIGKSRDELWK